MTTIKNGTVVTWTSQAQGSETQKGGVVIDYIPANSSASDVFEKHVKDCRFNPSDMQRYSTRSRYLICVQLRGKRGFPLKPKYYSPIAGVIERQNADKVSS
jgi:hypothetical protein